MSLALIPPHGWSYVLKRLLIDCPRCGGDDTSQDGLNELGGTVDLFCADCGWRGRVELLGWLPKMAPA